MSKSPAKTEKGALTKPPDYSDRSTQWRLMGIVGMVMAGFLLVKYGILSDLWGLATGNPETWSQFSGRPAETNVDTKLPRVPSGESPLEERSIEGKPVAVAQPEMKVATQVVPEMEPAAPPQVAEPGSLPGLDLKSLEVVEDDTVLRGKENDAWYGLCALVAKIAPAELAKHSMGPVRFVQVYRQPTVYRGKVVTVTGRIREANKLEASKNDHEIAGYTKCALLPSDGSNSPIFIYVMEMPAGFPTGENVDEEATIHAVFYKRLAYMAKDVPRTAPLFVARTFQWTPSVPKAAEEVPWGTLAALVVISAIVGVTIAIIALRRLSAPNDDLPANWNGLPKEEKK